MRIFVDDKEVNPVKSSLIDEKISDFITLKRDEEDIRKALKNVQNSIGEFVKEHNIADKSATTILLQVGTDAMQVIYKDKKIIDFEQIKEDTSKTLFARLFKEKTIYTPRDLLKEQMEDENGKYHKYLSVQKANPAFKVAKSRE